MAAPSRELVICARDRLLATAAVTSLVGERIWYHPPDNQGFPNIGGFDTFGIRDDATCLERSDITLNIHVWSRDGLDPLQDARSICHEIGRALHNFPLILPTNRLVTLVHRGERVFYDPDGLTGHGVVEFRSIITFN